MLGVWVNFFAVLIGGMIGALVRGGIPQKFRTTINAGLALCVMVIGISGAVKTTNAVVMIVSIVIGALAGELLRIEHGLDKLGSWAQARFAKGENRFAEGFVNTTLLVSVGAMAVVGSLECGLSGNSSTLLAKSALDFVSSIIFGSTLGIGAAAAAIPMTIYQGGIALLANVLSGFLSETMIQEMSAVGSVLIIALSLNMLDLPKERIRVGNMLPAMLAPCIYFPVAELVSRMF